MYSASKGTLFMSRSYRAPFAAVTGARSAADFGYVAQIGGALGLHPRGCRFNSDRIHQHSRGCQANQVKALV
jgi:hypothetical protein